MITAQQLGSFKLFADISQTDKERIAAECALPKVYQKGEVVYTSSSFQNAVGLILDGTVVVTATDGSTVMNRLSAGNMFGVAALFGAEEKYVTTITAKTTATVVFIPQQQMSGWLSRYPVIAHNYICFLSDKIRFLNHKLSVLTAGSAEGRLYQYLLTQRKEDGSVTLPRSMVELAGVLNMGRSSLYRAKDALLVAGFLRKVGKIYYVTE